ncbi:MAG: endonuclease V [Acidimicrobiia bacterium]
MDKRWPVAAPELEALQRKLGEAAPDPWRPEGQIRIGGSFVCFSRGLTAPGQVGDPAWAAAVNMAGRRTIAVSQAEGVATAPYVPGFLAAREGPLLEAAVTGLSEIPDVLLVNATGRDHPRRAGLALHLGWALDLPTVGVTHRPLLARGEPPGPWAGSHSPLWIGAEQVGWWLRSRTEARPIAVSPGWRTDLKTALEVVVAAVVEARTPEPIRQARHLARQARARQSRQETR